MSQGTKPNGSSSGQSSPFYHMYNNYNPSQAQQKKPHPSATTGDIYQQTPLPPPPYYSSNYSDTSSQPSAPPLVEQPNTFTPPPYPKDNNAYPPQGYLYGAMPQYSQPAPSPANVPNWPWIATPQPPIIPINSEQPRPEKSKTFCQTLTQGFVYCLFFILIIDFLKMIWFGGNYERSCKNGVIWSRLPNQIMFENDLRVSVVGGHLSSGNIKLVETNDAFPIGTIIATIRASPKSLLEHKDMDYSVTDNNNETHLQIHIPNQYNVRYCIHLEMTIYVPRNLNALTLGVQNTAIESEINQLLIDKVDIATSNALIHLNEWQGKSLALTSSNGMISLDGNALGNGVTIKTSNAKINTKKITSAESIELTTSNGAIHAQDLVSPLVKTRTSNARINVDHLDAKKAMLITSNGFVELSSSDIGESIEAKTSNAGMNVRVDKGKQIIADIKTTNASPTLYMPLDFEGSLELKTSSNNKVILEDPTSWLHIRTLSKGYILAERYESNADQVLGHINLKSSNANVHVYFDNNNDSDY